MVNLKRDQSLQAVDCLHEASFNVRHDFNCTGSYADVLKVQGLRMLQVTNLGVGSINNWIHRCGGRNQSCPHRGVGMGFRAHGVGL